MFQFLIDEDQEQNDPITEKSESSTINQNLFDDQFQVGDRIRSDKYCGVVRYIGDVGSYAGTWLGVEWDDPARGKHSGSVDGVEYFHSSIPNAASFIRPHKASKCKDVFSALQERYGYDGKVMSKMKLVDDNITPRVVRYDELKILDLAEQNIFDLGGKGELVKLCPNVEFLNLAENLITSWETLSEVCDSFEFLKVLDISGNPLLPFEKTTSQSENHRVPFPHLEHAIIGKVNYNWVDVLSASILWPQVTNLQVPFNLVSKIIPPTTSLLYLTSLDFESNKISSWDEVIKLNVCHGLVYLNLCGNQIQNIRFPVNPDDPKNCQYTRYFPKLTRLNISLNSIDDWISVSEINKLQCLTELRIELNPVFRNDTKESNRQMVIARVGKLTKLEGVEIFRQERRDAEIDYTKKFSEKWRKEGTELRFAIEHPRYVELIKKFGESEEGEMTKAMTNFQSTLITLELIPEGQKIKSCSRKLMPNMSIQKLKMLIQRIFKMATPISYLGIISSQNPGITFPLDNELFDLAQYSVEDGDKVIVRW